MKNKLWTVLIVAISLATILFFFHEVDNCSNNPSVNNCGGFDRRPASQVLYEICMNDGEFQNLTKGNYAAVNADGNIFNESGESIAYIRVNGSYIHEVIIEMQNGTLKTIGPDSSLEGLYKEADFLQGSVISIHSQITGGEIYVVAIDTPNGTVKSIEKVSELPEWTGTVEVVSENEPADKEELIFKLVNITGYSREELFGPVNPFGNKSNKREESLMKCITIE